MNIVLDLLQIYFKENYLLLVGIIIVSVLINLIQTNVISHITANIIDSVEHGKQNSIFTFFKYFIFASTIYFALYEINEVLQINLLTKLTQWLRKEFFKYMLFSNNENFMQTNLSKYNASFNRVSYAANSIINMLINSVLANVTFLLIVCLYFLWKNTYLGLTFIIANICICTYIYSIWNETMEVKNAYENNSNKNEAEIIDLYNNIDKVIYRGQTQLEANNYEKRMSECVDSAYKFYYMTNKHIVLMTSFSYITIFGSIYYLIQLKLQNKIDNKLFITFFTMLLLYREKMTYVIQYIPQFLEFNGRTNYVLNQLKDIKSDIKILENESKEYIQRDLPFDTFEFNNVSFKYDSNDSYVFQNLNMIINTPNKIIGITGTSGKGKSTMMKLLLRLYPCQTGNILIDGVDINEIEPNYIRKNIIYVNQTSKLFDRKVIDNIMYGCENSEHCEQFLKIIMEYPKISQLYKNVDFYSKGSGSLGENLSGGQRQIINIISGLVNPSKILILDEPTNALDIELKNELIGIIDKFRQYKKCIIIITHDRDVYPLFDERIKI